MVTSSDGGSLSAGDLSVAWLDMFEHAPYGCVFVDVEGRMVHANARAAELLGHPREQLIGRGVLELIGVTPSGRAQAERLFAQLQAGEPCVDEPLEVERADGTVARLRLTRRPIHDAEGRYLGAGGLLVEAGDDWATAPAGGVDERLQAAALASVGNAVFVTDADGTIVWVNDAFTQMSGYAPSEAIGQTPRLLKSGVQDAGHYEQLWATIRDRRIWRGEIVDRRKDGSRYRVWQTITPILDEQGELTHFVAVHEDITALRASQDRLQAIFDHALDAIVLFDDAGRLVSTNPALTDLTGYRPDELTSRSLPDLVPEEYRESYGVLWERFRADGKARVRLPIRRADGRLRQVESQAVADIADGVHLMIARDVTEQDRAEAQQRFQAQLLEAVGDAVIAVDRDGIVRYVNPAAEQLFALPGEQVLGQHVQDAYRGAGPTEELWRDVRDADARSRELTLSCPDGSSLSALVTVTPYFDAGGRLSGTIALITDVSDLEHTRQLLARRAHQQAAVAEVGQEAMRTENPRALGELVRRRVEELLDVELYWHADHGAPDGPSSAHIDIGDVGVLTITGAHGNELTSQDREFLGSLAHIVHAAVQRHAATTKLEYLATHDPLTGLANRTLFLDRLAQAAAACERHGGGFAVLFFDLDAFKTINDGLGHDIGDQVLRELADRLQSAVRPTDTLARFGGDEFAVLCPDISDQHTTSMIADRIHTTLSAGVDTGHGEVPLTASLGIIFGDHTTDTAALLRNADTAMYAAKEAGRNRTEVFDDHMQRRAHDRFQATARLQAALEGGRIEVRYQPTIDLATGRLAGVEALARLRDEDGQLRPPSEFIMVAEETGLITDVGEQVLRRACQDAVAWARHDPAFMLSVNLSPRQITHQDLGRTIRRVLDETGFAPERLWLEITESTLLAGPGVQTAMQQLRTHGIHFAIDDFGTGYSSLTHLRQMPTDMLKIDRSFVSGLQDSIQDHALVTATIYLARTFGLPTTAEGVETYDQLTELTDLGCEYAQGYYWSPPTDPATITKMLHDSTGPNR